MRSRVSSHTGSAWAWLPSVEAGPQAFVVWTFLLHIKSKAKVLPEMQLAVLILGQELSVSLQIAKAAV